MKKYCIWLSLVYFLYILQSSVLPLFSFHGNSTDFMLLFTVSVAFLYGSRMGAYAGFLTGLLQDLATGTFFGVDIFAKLVIGYICGLFSNRVYKEELLLPVAAAAVASIAHNLIVACFMLLLGFRFDFLQHIQSNWPAILCYNVVFALPVHYAVYNIFKYFSETKKTS